MNLYGLEKCIPYLQAKKCTFTTEGLRENFGFNRGRFYRYGKCSQTIDLAYLEELVFKLGDICKALKCRLRD